MPAVVAASSIPAMAASGCQAAMAVAGNASYNWGVSATDPKTTKTTDQVLTISGGVSLSGLPADAVITNIAYTYWIENRNDSATNADGSSGGHGPGIYDPGNSKASTRTSGSCSTSYSTVTGCSYTYGASGSPLSAPPSGASTSANPFTSGTAKASLKTNWTDHTFYNGRKTKAWQFVYQGDATKAQALLTKDSTGCLTLAQQSTPVFTVTYTGVLQGAHAEQTLQMDRTAIVTYTSGGNSYTLSKDVVSTYLCHTPDPYPADGVNRC